MENNNYGKVKKIGNWISAILLGTMRESIACIDERTILMFADIKDLKTDMKDLKEKMGDIKPKVELLWKKEIAASR
jgi:hypothetical protein